jgi:catechol 2,3-dioxygenase-like lactoylglutathione lyase family enzyme
MLRTRGIAHFTIPVSDIEKSVAFYTDIVGLELIRAHPGLIAFLRAGKDNVVLAKCEVPPKPVKPSAERMNVHHAFIVETRDFEDSLRFLAEKGIDVIDKDERMIPGAVFQGRSAYFYDPDGNILEIIDLAATAYRPIAVPVA